MHNNTNKKLQYTIIFPDGKRTIVKNLRKAEIVLMTNPEAQVIRKYLNRKREYFREATNAED